MRYQKYLAVQCLAILALALQGCIGYKLPESLSVKEVAGHYTDTAELKLPLYYEMVSEKGRGDQKALMLFKIESLSPKTASMRVTMSSGGEPGDNVVDTIGFIALDGGSASKGCCYLIHTESDKNVYFVSFVGRVLYFLNELQTDDADALRDMYEFPYHGKGRSRIDGSPSMDKVVLYFKDVVKNGYYEREDEAALHPLTQEEYTRCLGTDR